MRSFLLIMIATALTSFVVADTSPQQILALKQTIKPQRIASLNLCFDALLLKLVEPARINSLTYLSVNPQYSPFAAQAKLFHINRGLAEDLVPRNPDLIVAGEFGANDTKQLLIQLGFNVKTLALPRSLSEITAHIRAFGELVGSERAAEIMVQSIEQKIQLLDTAPQHSTAAITAFWYSSNGVVVGSDTLENELMTRAGFHNLALDRHIEGFAQIDLEELILAEPQVIIVEEPDVEAFSLAREYMQHPVLRNNTVQVIALPATLSVCSAPVVADVIQKLIDQKNALQQLH